MFKRIVVILVVMAFFFTPITSEAATKPYKIKRLVSQLYDRPEAMNAQRQLVGYGKEVTPYVLPLLKDKNNESVRVAALSIIAQVNDPSAEKEVTALLKDRDNRVRKEAAKTLSVIAKSDASVEPLKRLLTDPFPEVRFNALKALATLAREEETNIFIGALGDYDPRIRMFAVKALGDLKSKEAVPYLVQMVRDPDPGVRMMLAIALPKIATPDCLQGMQYLMNDPEVEVRILAVDNLVKLNVKGVDEVLIVASENMDPRISSRAIWALGVRKSPQALSVARAHLEDEYMDVKVASIGVVGMMGDKSDVPVLKTLLEAESSTVRKESRKALGEVNAGK